jgi:hypothetical protein
MRKYRVFVRGQNFLFDLDGKVKRFGFYTTRFVEANDELEARQSAITMLRQDPKLLGTMLNEEFDAPMLFTEEIAELDSFDGVTLPGPGFAFYPDDEDEAIS